MIARDAPAQVDNGGRRRDGDLVLTIVRVAFDRAVEGRLSNLPAAVGSMRRSAGGLGFPALADALGAFWNILRFGISSQGLFLGAVLSAAAPFFFAAVREFPGSAPVPFAGEGCVKPVSR
jgi:hypothetical protein